MYIGVSVAANFPDNDNRSSLKIYIGRKWGVCDLCVCVCVYKYLWMGISVNFWSRPRPVLFPPFPRLLANNSESRLHVTKCVCRTTTRLTSNTYNIYLYLSDHRHTRKSWYKGIPVYIYSQVYSYLVRPIFVDKSCSPCSLSFPVRKRKSYDHCCVPTRVIPMLPYPNIIRWNFVYALG